MEESEEEESLVNELMINNRKWTCSDVMIQDLKLFYLDKYKKSISLQRKTESGSQAYTGNSKVMYCSTSLDGTGRRCEGPLCKLRIPMARNNGIWKLAKNKKNTFLKHSEQCMGSAIIDSKDKNVVSAIIARDGGAVTTLNSAGISPELRRQGIDVNYTGTT